MKRLACLLALAAGWQQVFAGSLDDPDLSPLIHSIGLPSAAESARLAPAGQSLWRLAMATASHSIQASAAGENLLFDGETTRVTLAAEFGLSERLQLGIELPWLQHDAGQLDGFIRRWHGWFGLPNGLRDQVPDDRLAFIYEDAGGARLEQRQHSNGFGDLRLLAAWQLQRNADFANALRASLKLATGDSARLTGSGAHDLHLGFVGEHYALFGSPRWQGHYGIHAVFVGQPDRLASRSRRVIGKLTGGLTWLAHPRLDLSAQASLRSAAYDSGIRVLGDTALQLNVGGSVKLAERLQLHISVGEDVRVNTAPDVTLGLSLRYDSEH